jgi:adenosine deaminase
MNGIEIQWLFSKVSLDIMNYIKSILCLVALCHFAPTQANVQTHLNQIKNNPKALYTFFQNMPKGGELHYHLAGGPYPEIMLQLAAKNNYCINTKTFAISKNLTPCKGVISKDILNKPALYEKIVRSWSLKDFVPKTESAYDHFFNSFNKFLPIVLDYRPELIADVLKVAAKQQEQYLELIVLPDNGHSTLFGSLLKETSSWDEKRKILLANKDFQKNIQYTMKESDRILEQAYQILGCDNNPQAAYCKITIKFLYYSLREQPLDNLFAQTLNAFEAVSQSQNKHGALVGVNLVQPENGLISVRDYHQQMLIYHYFHQHYPKVNITLHAGELTKELVAPNALKFHIRDALLTGQAQRIGHGVDITHELQATDTLKYMATQHKAVEINLISNLKLLDVAGPKHPLNYYLANSVPVVFSTDDEGILRTDLTSQYVEAVLNHHLDYPTLKQINRNTLTYAFIPGASIWLDADKAQLTPNCQELQSERCKKFIKNSQKAQLQWNLEQKLDDFEKRY